MIENQSVKVQVETCPSTPPPDGKVKGESMSRDHESRAVRVLGGTGHRKQEATL
jgi:hypothetical protein